MLEIIVFGVPLVTEKAPTIYFTINLNTNEKPKSIRRSCLPRQYLRLVKTFSWFALNSGADASLQVTGMNNYRETVAKATKNVGVQVVHDFTVDFLPDTAFNVRNLRTVFSRRLRITMCRGQTITVLKNISRKESGEASATTRGQKVDESFPLKVFWKCFKVQDVGNATVHWKGTAIPKDKR